MSGESCGRQAASHVVAGCSGGKICLTDHFKPLWARNVPRFGIAHAMALGVRLCSGISVVAVVVTSFITI